MGVAVIGSTAIFRLDSMISGLSMTPLSWRVLYCRVTIARASSLSSMGSSKASATPWRVMSSWVGPRPPVVKMRSQPSATRRLIALAISGTSSRTVMLSFTLKLRGLSLLMIHWLLVSSTTPSRISLPTTRIPTSFDKGAPTQ